MSRGGQRERDRAKNQAKQQAKAKSNAKEGNPLQRNENDAAALQAKLAAKAAKKQEEAQAGPASKGPVPRKAKPKKDEGLDDLLSAGLSGNKKKGAK